MRQLTTELGSSSETATTIYEDNQSAISVTKTSTLLSNTYHFFHEQVSNGTTVQLQYGPTGEMVADMFMKGLSREQFCKLRGMAGIVQLPGNYV